MNINKTIEPFVEGQDSLSRVKIKGGITKEHETLGVQSPSSYFKHIAADAFSGALWALEGVRNGVVILNAPTGCKFYHASVSNGQFCRGTSYNPAQIGEEFYFRQNRIPCTYLDGNDFVYGSEEKLRKAIKTVVDSKHGFVAVVNSPGAALIGDNLNDILKENLTPGIPFVSIENTGFSEPFNRGFQSAGVALLNALGLKAKPVQKRTINLIGFSIYQKHYEGNITELQRLLNLCGVSVTCNILSGCTTEDLYNSTSASLNVVVAPEFGAQIAGWYQNNFNIPVCQLLAPIGYDATKCWVEAICEKLNVSSEPAIEQINYARAVSFMHVQSLNSLSGFPKGASYSIKADLHVARGIYNFLTPYLGMLPNCIELTDNIHEDSLNAFQMELKTRGFENSLGDIEDGDCHLLFADGNTIAQEKASGKFFTGVEIALPSLGYTDVIPKCVMGAQGALYIIEQVINGLKYFCK